MGSHPVPLFDAHSYVCVFGIAALPQAKETGREGGRIGGMEGRREGRMEGGREGWREVGTEGGRVRWMEGGRDGEREDESWSRKRGDQGNENICSYIAIIEIVVIVCS